ncbi:Protein of unknown function [Pyronema omphalodes CBS 100304]|uniref:Uncharacterized protein n=1 Tax=Pyronema omphalodes (strain CBS 100304) TaxID=1076935 RepID=U4LEL4_PYROM|nr:Protein of unknown function [Pyronema omphalodes CBS 100304]
MKFTSLLIILPFMTSAIASAVPAADTEPALEARQNCAGRGQNCSIRRCCPGLICVATGPNPRIVFYVCT